MSRTQLRRRRIGQLDTIEIEGSSADAPTVVLFHGFGADCADLASLGQVVQAPKGTRWIFPNGHLRVPLGDHNEGRAWFPISIAALEESMASGAGVDLSTIKPPGMKRARDLALDMIGRLGVPMEKIVLGGFSQGAMLAMDITLNSETSPAGLALLSGTLVNAPEWETLAGKHAGLKFFQSHGIADPVLSFAMADRLEKLLVQAGWQGRMQRFHGGHEIPSEVLIQLGAYLRASLGKTHGS